jgi:diadenosine tetraphosphate (Ap4A) HIT family hydrolase
MVYDRNNAFARMLRSEVPCNKVYEDEHVLAFHDISPQAATHVIETTRRLTARSA